MNVADNPCPRCGASTSEGEQFCESCGSELTAAQSAPAEPAPSESAPTLPAEPAESAERAEPAESGEPTDSGSEATDANRVDEPAPRACAACGGRVADDGYCEQCGARAGVPRDHVVTVPAPWVAGVSDRGLRHRRNEDAVAAAVRDDVALLVVCDGVTTAPNSDQASAAAVTAALTMMTDALAAGILAGSGDRGTDPKAGTAEARTEVLPTATVDVAREDVATGEAAPEADSDEAAGTGSDSDRTDAEDEADEQARVASLGAVADAALGGVDARDTAAARLLTAAAAAAAVAVRDTVTPEGEAASCTFVAAVVVGNEIVAGNVGDSRAYWLPDTGPAQLLTLDDSWATELLARGMPRAEAETAYGAHAITRWLGPDSPDIVPRPRRLTADGPGWLLLCSDGLWNYCSEPQDLAALVGAGTNALGAEAGPLTLAETLVAWANGHGGHDNITVALARLDPSPAAPAPLTDPTAGV